MQQRHRFWSMWPRNDGTSMEFPPNPITAASAVCRIGQSWRLEQVWLSRILTSQEGNCCLAAATPALILLQQGRWCGIAPSLCAIQEE